jgi:hypothetical protein
MPSPQTANVRTPDAAPRKPAGTRTGRGPSATVLIALAALTELREMARLESRLTADPAAREVWHQVDLWAAGYAQQRLHLSESHPLCLPATFR